MAGDSVKTRTGTLSIDEELGVARFEYVDGVDVNLADAKENVAAMKSISKGKSYPLICKTSGCRSIDKGARTYFGSAEAAAAYKAIAFVGGTPVSNMYTNFFIALFSSKEAPPTKGFSTEADALNWVKGLT